MRGISCSLEILSSINEEAWMVFVDESKISSVAISLYALKLEIIDCVTFLNTNKCKQPNEQLRICRNVDIGQYSIECNGHILAVTEVWIDAIASMLIRTLFNGWAQTSHIDQDFVASSKEITICFGVHPPR